MMNDKQMVLTYTSATYPDRQTFGDKVTTPTHYQVDMGANQTSYANGVDGSAPVSSPGNTTGLYLVTQVITNDTTHSTPSLLIQLMGSATEAFTAGELVATTGEIQSALTVANTLIVLPFPPGYSFRYWRAEVILDNDDNSFVLKIWIASNVPTPYMQLGPAELVAG
jgi:hypothetical protein